jgi:allophanate hydrolase subunit 2
MWTTEIMLKLTEDLYSTPCLWDSSSAYKDRNKKSDVTASLAVKYSVTVEELDKKLQTLKCQFRRKQKPKAFQEEWKVSKRCARFGYEPLMFLLSQEAPETWSLSNGLS